MPESQDSDSWIAIVGMACHFPGADNPAQYWENIKLGIESRASAHSAGPDEQSVRHDGRNWVNATFCCAKPDHFDAKFFGYSPSEASLVDPQQRLLLHTAWEAIEDAGYDLTRYSGTVGVFAGVGPNWYAIRNLATRQDIVDRVGLAGLFASDKDFAATRIAHFMDLRGPAIGVQTACSTSLVAVHLASQSLLAGECDMALVGAASIRVPFDHGYEAIEGGILSPTGRCRAFDAVADGTVPGSGAGIVVLKRFDDAVDDRDNIVAVLRGTAVNNNGAATAGFTAPSARGQAEAISLAQRLSGIPPGTIGLIEAHGTGTKLGDPIEIEGLKLAFGVGNESNSCAIGSVKTNIGHLDTAAGIAGLIKAALALKHRMLPPSSNFTQLNDNISFENTPFYINKQLRDWSAEAEPRRACVSSFGIGGTNAHAVLEEAPPSSNIFGGGGEPELLIVSARTPEALAESARRLTNALGETDDPYVIANMAFTLATGRRAWPYRGFILAGGRGGPSGIVAPYLNRTAVNKDKPVVFVVSGQLPRSSMLIEQLREEYHVFDVNLRRCWDAFVINGGPRLTSMLRDTVLQETVTPDLALPLAFSVNYALAKLWMAQGVTPQTVIGHGIGDYVAACLTGAYEIEEIAPVLAKYANNLGVVEKGFMVSVDAAPEALEAILPQRVYISSVNSMTDCIVSGPQDASAQCFSVMEEAGIQFRLLPAQLPFHSPLMAPAVENPAIFPESILRRPKTSWSSSSQSALLESDKPLPQRFWAEHTCGKLNLQKAILNTPNQTESIFLEIALGNQLTPLLQKNLKASSSLVVGALSENNDITPRQQMLRALGRVWANGGVVGLQELCSKEYSRRVSLPSYPFNSQRFWIEPGDQSPVSDHRDKSELMDTDRPLRAVDNNASMSSIEKIITTVWSTHLGIPDIALDDDFFEIGGDSLIATSIFSDIRARLQTKLESDLIYRHPTARSLAEFLSRQDDGARLARIAEIYLQVENLSDAEVQTGLATRAQSSKEDKQEA